MTITAVSFLMFALYHHLLSAISQRIFVVFTMCIAFEYNSSIVWCRVMYKETNSEIETIDNVDRILIESGYLNFTLYNQF